MVGGEAFSFSLESVSKDLDLRGLETLEVGEETASFLSAAPGDSALNGEREKPDMVSEHTFLLKD